MKANELRIGNCVILNSANDYSKPIEHTLDAIDISVCVIDEKRFSPIPLTHKILVKCGFENKSKTTDYHFFINSYGCDINIGGARKSMYPCIMGECGLEAFGNELKYLHQLQNLYFALTGTELEVNL
jgi:hypothetical protein